MVDRRSARIAFLPWVTLPEIVDVGDFRFVPTDTKDLSRLSGAAMSETISRALRVHVDQSGRPIETCTIVLNSIHSLTLDLPEESWDELVLATDILALACLAEQRFLTGHFSPHLNATMFRVVSQRVTAGSDQFGLVYPRRGGPLQVSGRKFENTLIQQPPQIEGTRCGHINIKLVHALHQARKTNNLLWSQIISSLELFLLAHAETPELAWDTCIMLSAIAFERLLNPKKRNADNFASEFAELWKRFSTLTIQNSKKPIRPDPRWEQAQKQWLILKKWAKEIYEVRSSRAHLGPREDLQRNWEDWQHIIILAFAYPLSIKIILDSHNFYKMNIRENAACKVFDKLLDSHWGDGWERAPEWSRILSEAEAAAEIEESLKKALTKPEE